MADFINTVDVVGDDALTDSIITRSITDFADNTITVVGTNAFKSCTALTRVDLPSVTSMGDEVFHRCSSLTTLILRSGTLVTSGFSQCQYTPIASGTGYIYVPRELVDSYKSAKNWRDYPNQFRALEDYTVDGTTTGELDPTKI